MNFVSLIVLMISSFAFAQSKNKVLFLDINDNPKEIEIARKSAMANGQEFVLYPLGKNPIKEEELHKIISENKFNRLVISGHNGGNEYHGDKGEINITTLLPLLQNSPSRDSIQSVYLLGCNSANKAKIFFWKEAIPGIQFIAGYDGTAPLGSNQKGLNLFADTLKKEESILAAKNASQIKTLLKGLNSVSDFESSIYLSCSEEDKDYIFMPKRLQDERFGILDTKECSEKIKEFKSEWLGLIKQYWAGEMEPTKLDPSDGFLKKAYVFIRQNEHCMVGDGDEGPLSEYTGDNLLFLRFNHAFNQNFLEYYQDEFKQSLTDIDRFLKDPEVFAKGVYEQKKKYIEDMEKFRKNPSLYKAVLLKETKTIKENKAKITAGDAALAQCITNYTMACEQFKVKLRKWYEEDFKEKAINQYLPQTFEYSSTYNPDPLSSVYALSEPQNKAQILELQKLLSKAVNEPSKMTRKDLMTISKLINVLPSNGIIMNSRLNRHLSTMEELDGDTIPFSWHERLPNKAIEPPRGAIMGKIGYFQSRFPKELESLALAIDNQFED